MSLRASVETTEFPAWTSRPSAMSNAVRTDGCRAERGRLGEAARGQFLV
jgi:hypothetical protein